MKRAAAFVLGFALAHAVAAGAHCDGLDGPVVSAARAALESGDAAPVPIWVRAWEFRTADVSPRVTQDVLLLAGSRRHYVPLRQLPRQMMALTNARSVTARVLTPAEHAENHCQIGNVGLAVKVILDWLATAT